MAGAPQGLLTRVLSAAILAPVAAAAAYLGGGLFAVFWAVAAVAVVWEWMNLAVPADAAGFVIGGVVVVAAAVLAATGRPLESLMAIAAGTVIAVVVIPSARRIWIGCGIAYASLLVFSPVIVRGDSELGAAAIFLLFAIVWTTDVLGYFAGRAFGGPKLAPSISPAKTWSGAIAGIAGSALVAVAGASLITGTRVVILVAVALVLSATSQVGDLLESALKRKFGVKDASRLIPGHGGVMDRLDGFWAASLCAMMIGVARGGFAGAAKGLLLW